ncbi:MAG: S-layer homology domain-containing protein, partial [Niameybacter sp.]
MKRIYKLAPLILSLALVTPTFATDYTNHWAKASIDKWTSHNIVAGYDDGTFRPNNNVTRAELATFITRAFGLADTTHSRKYTDVDASKWYADAVDKVSAQGIMYTPGNQFLPHQKVTREEAAYAIYRAYQISYTETPSLVDYR